MSPHADAAQLAQARADLGAIAREVESYFWRDQDAMAITRAILNVAFASLRRQLRNVPGAQERIRNLQTSARTLLVRRGRGHERAQAEALQDVARLRLFLAHLRPG
jgi:hypothetical protein